MPAGTFLLCRPSLDWEQWISMNALSRGQQTCSVKYKIVNILGYVGHMISVTLFNSAIVGKQQQTKGNE